MLAFPVLLLGLGLATACSGENGCLGGLIQPGLSVVIFIIVIANTPYVARIIRGQVLSLREKEFVEASRSLGASNWRIMFRDILPNLVAPIIVYATLFIPANILLEAALSFLGVGVQPPRASWGDMLSDAVVDLRRRLVVHVLPGHGAAADRAGLQPGRRRAAGRAQPQGHAVDDDPRPLFLDSSSSSDTHERTLHATVLPVDHHPRRSARPHPRRGRLRRRRRRRQRRAGLEPGHARGGQEGRQAHRRCGPSDVDNIDPGITYYQMGYMVDARDAAAAVPLQARRRDRRRSRTSPRPIRRSPRTARPSRSRSSSGVKFSPPVNREVTSKDVKYAIERGFFNTVNNGYAGAYFGDLEGAKVGAKPGTKISGHQDARRPDDRVQPQAEAAVPAASLAGALALPLIGAGAGGVRGEVRREEAVDVRPEPGRDRPVHDRERRVAARRSATRPASSIHLVRNPNWDKTPDYTPGLPRRDRHAAGQRRHHGRRRARSSTAQSMINGDFVAAAGRSSSRRSRARRTSSSSCRAAAAAGSR